MLQAVVFDMDGLLLDTERPALIAWSQAAEELGIELPESVILATVGVDWESTKRIITGALGSGAPREALVSRTQEIYRRWFDDFGVQAKPGAIELLRKLREHGIPAGIATSSSRKSAEWKLGKAGLLPYISGGACGDEVSRGKPYPDVFLKSASELKADPAYCAALEDSPAGITAAKAAGMTAILVPDLVKPADEVAGRADYVVSDLFEASDLIFRNLI